MSEKVALKDARLRKISSSGGRERALSLDAHTCSWCSIYVCELHRVTSDHGYGAGLRSYELQSPSLHLPALNQAKCSPKR